MSISPDNDTDSTGLHAKYEPILDVVMCMEDDVDAPAGVDINGDVNMELDGEDGDNEDEEYEMEDVVVDEDEEEDEDNGKEPRTIGQGEIVNASADDVHTIVDDKPSVLPEQCKEMREHTQRQQPPAPAPPPQTTEPPPRPRSPVTHTLRGRACFGLVTPQKLGPAAPTLREAEAARNAADVDVGQQLLGESAGGDGLPDGPLPDVPLLDVALPDVPLPDVPVPDVPLPEARLDGSVGKESTSPQVAEGACVWDIVMFLSCEFPLV